MNSWIDLRSDTVTMPTDEMRVAMARADLGDDCYGDDPTVNQLQELAADRLGKQSALFVPSGTMGNLISVMVHCGRGDEVILGNRSHIYLLEAGGVSALGGVHTFAVPNQEDGSIQLEALESSIKDDKQNYPRTRLVCLENTQNVCGGTVLSVEYTRQVGELTRNNRIALHIDGARIFNAAVALNEDVRELVASANSVTFCLSKGLSAPVGSLICGDEEFIQAAYRIRRQLGGGMRQAGVLAAAGIIALDSMIDRLAEDHERARHLADLLASLPGVELEIKTPPTNIIFFRLTPQAAIDTSILVDKMADYGIKLAAPRAGRFRLVTHSGINDTALECVEKAFSRLLT